MTETKTTVVELVEAALDDPRPLIRLAAGRLAEIATEGEAAILAAGFPVYRRGATLVRPVVEDVYAAHGRKTKAAQLAMLDATALRDVLAQAARWERYVRRERQWIAADPPKDVAATILSRFGAWTFPAVAGIITTPTLRPDGSLLVEPGYDVATRLILADPPAMPGLPAEPTREDAKEALALLDGLLEEFPLVDDASRSVALSGLITPVVRGAFPVAPMHGASAPAAGTGKSYLFDVAAVLDTGQLMPVIAAGRTEEETEKRLGAALLTGQPLVCIDNITGGLGGDFLCQAIERPTLEIRPLGRSERIRIEARGTTLYATGNNLTLLGDMTRRAIVATLDPGVERPELRQFTRNPVADVLADRGRYVAAALTICRAYITAGCPDPAPALVSFEGWSNIVRSALIWLGCADPIETMEGARADDPELAALRAFLAAWSDALGTGWRNRYALPDILKLVDETTSTGRADTGQLGDREYRNAELRDAVLAVATIRGRSDARIFGAWARTVKGRVVDGRRLIGQADDHGHAARWWIETV